MTGVSCTAGSATAPADSSARKESVKTRAATPTPFDPIRPGVEFLADGSCRLSQQAIVAHPDARHHCQADPSSRGAAFGCPAKYCETLK
jgi:poly(3-hydroxybutyrate) depolymerase